MAIAEEQGLENVVDPEKPESIAHRPRQMTCNPTEHIFLQTAGMEASCQKCPMGFILGLGMYVDQGHIYIDGQKLI